MRIDRALAVQQAAPPGFQRWMLFCRSHGLFDSARPLPGDPERRLRDLLGNSGSEFFAGLEIRPKAVGTIASTTELSHADQGTSMHASADEFRPCGCACPIEAGRFVAYISAPDSPT